jgi:hypothetical protein
MSGRNRLPGGEMRKASQRRARPAEVRTISLKVPWRAGDKVRWRDRAGVYRRDIEDGEPRSCWPSASTACAGPSCGLGKGRLT